MAGDRLFDPDEFSPASATAPSDIPELPEGSRVVRVVPDVSGLEKSFDYYCPPKWAERAAVGSLVRVDLHGRRVGGWIVDVDGEPPHGVILRPLARISSAGPPADVVDLARWIAHRWHGPLRAVLKSASPRRAVRSLPTARTSGRHSAASSGDQRSDEASELAEATIGQTGVTAVQTSPCTNPLPFILAAHRQGSVLVVSADGATADQLVSDLRRHKIRAGRYPYDWSAGLTGSIVVGQRSAVLAPMPTEPGTIVVLDDHVESMQEERVPTWHAADVAVERTRRTGGRCVLVGPMAAVTGQNRADRTMSVSRAEERAGWPIVDVVDRRLEDPKLSSTLLPPLLVDRIRDADRVLLILNRKGRARMLACANCLELVRTEDGQHLMTERDGRLESSSGESRPVVCAHCGSTRLKRLRPGISRVVEEAEALLGRSVVELSSDTAIDPGQDSAAHRVVVGTEAALYRVEQRPDVIGFLDVDQELYAPRFKAGEQTMALLVRAARLLGGRRHGGRLVVSTRAAEHPALVAAQSADMRRFAEPELDTRRLLSLPPFSAVAELSGAQAEAVADELRASGDLDVVGPRPDGRFLIKASDSGRLASALSGRKRSGVRVRVAVDPPRA